jgi:hypothetical protein
MTKNIFIAFVKKLLGIQSPSGLIEGYKYEYDMLRASRKKRRANND